MTNKQIQDVLKQYPDDCEVVVEKCTLYESGEIVRIRAEYNKYLEDFKIPTLTLEYENIEQ